MTSPRDDFTLVMRVPNSAAHSLPPKAAAPTCAPEGAAAVPLAVPICEWLGGCNRVATDHHLCSTHADKCRDLIQQHERGDLQDDEQ